MKTDKNKQLTIVERTAMSNLRGRVGLTQFCLHLGLDATQFHLTIFHPSLETRLVVGDLRQSLPRCIDAALQLADCLRNRNTVPAGLRSGDGRTMIDSVVWAQYINVTNRQTHRQPRRRSKFPCRRTATSNKNISRLM